jgi:diguanylate cyclase (GGDEF)-like protein
MTYRSRLLIYVGMLIALLLGMMTLSFKAARDVIVSGTEEQLRHVALRKESAINGQIQELDHYTDVIVNDMRLQEYLYIVLELGTSGDSLKAYYDRQYGALPTDWHLILSVKGDVLLGQEHFNQIVALHDRLQTTRAQHFFLESPDGVVMVATRPMLYHGERLATVVVARLMDQAWLNRQEESSRDYLLFFERGGNVLWSSNPHYLGQSIDLEASRLVEGDDEFRLRKIVYAANAPYLPTLWFGVADSTLKAILSGYQRWVYTAAIFGSVAVLFVGWLVLRNFSKPMKALMATTDQMIKGELPVMARSEVSNEMDELVNRFADVLDALRREQANLEEASRKLRESAITDSMTGLHNRRYLQEVTPGLFAQVIRDKRYLTAVLLDLDFFKAINDSWGHLGGDAVLVHFANLLKRNSRANDHLFRIGGEEFMILNVTEDPHDSVIMANKLRELVSQSPASYQGNSLPITVSIGVSCCHGDVGGEISLSTLMRAADKALYEAKSSGRNRVVLHASCQKATSARLRLRPRSTTGSG